MFRERALLHCTTLFRGQRRRICFCGAHGTILSLAQNRGFCRQGVPATLFRENALPHYQAYCAAGGLIALPDVILSRRACGVSKNLLRLPQSSCNAIMPMLRPLLSFRPKQGVKRRAERRNLSRCTIVFAMYICPCSIPSPYCNPARSFDFVPRHSLGTSLRMTGWAAWRD